MLTIRGQCVSGVDELFEPVEHVPHKLERLPSHIGCDVRGPDGRRAVPKIEGILRRAGSFLCPRDYFPSFGMRGRLPISSSQDPPLVD